MTCVAQVDGFIYTGKRLCEWHTAQLGLAANKTVQEAADEKIVSDHSPYDIYWRLKQLLLQNYANITQCG